MRTNKLMGPGDKLVDSIAEIASSKTMKAFDKKFREISIHKIVDPSRVLSIADARKVFGVSREIIQEILLKKSVHVKYMDISGGRAKRLFLYRDFERALGDWMYDKDN